jgi:hypothetical protein
MHRTTTPSMSFFNLLFSEWGAEKARELFCQSIKESGIYDKSTLKTKKVLFETPFQFCIILRNPKKSIQNA